MTEGMEWVLMFVGQVAVAGAIYGGIRADLRNLRERTNANEQGICRLHKRIDAMIIGARHHAD